MRGDERRVIFMQPGPLHLFWTTGVFYFWELKDRFDFVFIVPSNYFESNEFRTLIELPSVRYVEYLTPSTIFWRYQTYQKKIKKILKDYEPAYILLHNISYPENQYLIYLSKKLYPKSIRFHYQNGRMSLMWEEDFLARRSVQIEGIFCAYPWTSHFPRLTLVFVVLRNHASYFLHLKIIPFCTIARTFTPPVNVFNGTVNKKVMKHNYQGKNDKIFTYLAIEAQTYKAQGAYNVVKIKHPMSMCSNEVFRFLYGDFVIHDQIVVFPSYGFTSGLIEKGWAPNRVVNHVSERWFEAIKTLLMKLPAYKVKLKLHPASKTDELWRQIVAQLQIKLGSRLEVIQTNVSAEFLVVQSKVIVGDVTSVLWWASLYGNKIVISFDIFGYIGGDEMHRYEPDIKYVKNLSQDIPMTSMSSSFAYDGVLMQYIK